MKKDQQDRALQEAISKPVKAGAKAGGRALKKKAAMAAEKAFYAAGKALAIAGKSILAALAPVLPIIFILFAIVGVVYIVIIKPVSVYNELRTMKEEGNYGGKALAVYLDIEEEWDEQLDTETIELYESFKDKCLEGLNKFERNQAKQFALPYSMITSIERIELFAWGNELEEGAEPEIWQPRPEEVYEALKTNYEWIKSDVDYEAVYTYSYNYRYTYEVYIPPVYDENGDIVEEGYYEERTETGKGTDKQRLKLPFNVRLLSTADAFDNIYVHEYGDYEIQRDLASGSRAYHMSDSGFDISKDDVESGYDGYEGLLLKLGLSDEIIKDAESVMGEIREGFHSGAYDIDFDFEFDIESATKYYQPLKGVTPEGEQFERVSNYLKERYELNDIQEIDLQTILEIAADHDEEFAYNFVSNSDGFAYFSNMQNYYYSALLSGQRVPLMVEATAYCPGTPGSGCPKGPDGYPYCTGPYTDGYTATGVKAAPGDGTLENPHIIAVDPRVIPLKTVVYIPGYGYASAEDTGGAIKGNRIDILFAKHSDALKFGRKNIQIFVMRSGLAWPVPPEFGQAITSYFGPRWGRFHYGIDIGSYGGANHPIIASANGVVTFADRNGSYGNCVIINHGRNNRGQEVETLYAHLARIDARVGKEVRQGEVVGLMGTTGRSTGVHLHFEVRINGAKQNPLNFFEPGVYQKYQ